MKKLILTLLLAITCTSIFAQSDYKGVFPFAAHQADVMLKETEAAKASAKPNELIPRNLQPNGDLHLINTADWCSGFFPGNLWFLYEQTGDKQWADKAKPFTSLLEAEQKNKGTHDLGFMIYNSVGNAYRLTHDTHYKDVVVQAAKTLVTRFNPIIGCIRSWDWNKDGTWKFPVIIDNMMNLELLFEATKMTGDSTFYKIAVKHANTTMKNHYRPNYSSFHVIDYDPETGAVRHKQTAQGFADGSAWARGQAWGLYGFILCYRETHNPVYLQQAENIAKFILTNPNMPADLVPYWDYDATDLKSQPRDASAAAIAASALYELSTFSKNGKQYKATADKILSSLHKSYEAKPNGSRGFLLLHSTGHKPAKSEVDVPIIYADYYYLEALLRQKRLAEKKPVVNVAGTLKY